MAKPDLVPLLRAHKENLSAAPMPIGAKHRIAAALRERAEQRAGATGGRRILPMLTFVAGAALVMVVAGYNLLGGAPERVPAAESPARTLAGYTVAGDQCHGALDGTVTQLSGECRLTGPSMRVQTWDAVRIVPGPTSAELLSGKASFEVSKVAPGDPSVRVVVSHGIIEVLGTRFTVEQDEGGGSVELFEGHIRYVPVDPPGEAVEILPGGRHAWGDRAAPVVVAVDPEPLVEVDAVPPGDVESARPTRRKLSTESHADAIIEEVTSLRAQGRYRRAAGVLRRALKLRWRVRTAQVLSYELGSILERHLGDAAAACRHWTRHQARYPTGRYAGAVARSLKQCPR